MITHIVSEVSVWWPGMVMKPAVGQGLSVGGALTNGTARVGLNAAKGRRPEGPSNPTIDVSFCAVRVLNSNPAVVFMSWRAG